MNFHLKLPPKSLPYITSTYKNVWEGWENKVYQRKGKSVMAYKTYIWKEASPLHKEACCVMLLTVIKTLITLVLVFALATIFLKGCSTTPLLFPNSKVSISMISFPERCPLVVEPVLAFSLKKKNYFSFSIVCLTSDTYICIKNSPKILKTQIGCYSCHKAFWQQWGILPVNNFIFVFCKKSNHFY